MSEETTKHMEPPFRGAETAGETWAEFWAWWKEQCAVMDAKPKQGIRRMALVPTDKKLGRNFPKDSKKILGARFIK